MKVFCPEPRKVCVCNLKPSKLRGVVSNGMLLAAVNRSPTSKDEEPSVPLIVELVTPPASAQPGHRIAPEDIIPHPAVPYVSPKVRSNTSYN